MKTPLDTRPSPIAGHWYPDQREALRGEILNHLRQAGPGQAGKSPMAILAPHAGLRYSGPVAAYAFRHLQSHNFKRVVVAGPYHYPHTAALLTSAHQAYETPLGRLAVDHEGVQAIDRAVKTRLGIGLTPISRDPEHSLEMELPFLQVQLGDDFRLLPIMMVDQSSRVATALGAALARLAKGGDTLLVASSDLSHFYPEPEARRLDRAMLQRVEALDPDGVLQAEASGVGYACGRGAIAAVFHAAKALGAAGVRIERYATSADVTGDHASVVGYAAACLLAGDPDPS